MVPPSPHVIMYVRYGIIVFKNNTLGFGGMCYLRLNYKNCEFLSCFILIEIILENLHRALLNLAD